MVQSIEEVFLRDPHHVAHRDRDPFPLLLFLGGIVGGLFGTMVFGLTGGSALLVALAICAPFWVGAWYHRRAVSAASVKRTASAASEDRADRERETERRIAEAKARGSFACWQKNDDPA